MKNEFICGIGYAIARIIELHDEPQIANDIMKESNYSLGDFIEAGVDEHDIKFLEVAWNDFM